MANHTFLFETESAEPIQRKEEPTLALAAGSNSIPVFWYSLFDENCISTNKVLLQDGRLENYPYLVTSTNEALKRLSARRSILEGLLPGRSNIITDKWIEFVKGISLPFIHMEAAELWMMLGNDDFQAYIDKCLRAYNVDGPTGIRESKLWLEMLDVAQIDISNPVDTKLAQKLVGYTWRGKSVAWVAQ